MPKGGPRAVKILLSDAAYLDDLIAYLFTVDCIVQKVGPNLVEVSRLSSIRHDQARMEIEVFLEAWKSSHPEVAVRLLG